MTGIYAAIKALSPGDAIVYHRGHLVADCESRRTNDLVAAREARDGARRAHDEGLCLLTQRRNPDRSFDYIATRRRGEPGRGFMRTFVEDVA